LEALKWIGGGFLALLAYVVVSNTLYLLIGARLLQMLPGVNIKGFRGTLKIAAMLVLAVCGFGVWVIKRPLAWIGVTRFREPLRVEIARWVGRGARTVNRVFARREAGGVPNPID
jgi:hypothetical protein